MGSYEELILYQKSRQVVKAVDGLIKNWLKTMQVQEISRQLFRSATCVGANNAEGHGRHQGIEYIHYLIIAQGSANETEHWLHTAQDCGLGPKERIDELINLNNEVVRMITSTIHTIREKQQTKRVREDQPDYFIDLDQVDEQLP